MRARHDSDLVRHEVHARDAAVVSLQRLHALEIPRGPHYPSPLLRACPTLHRLVEPSADQKLPRRVKPNIRNHAAVRRHRVDRLLLPQVPDLDRVVVARRRQLRRRAPAPPTWNPFGANLQHSMPFAWPCIAPPARPYLQNQRAAPRPQVPHAAHARLVARRREAPVALEGQPHHVARVAVLQQQLRAGLHVPQAERGVQTHRSHEAACGSERARRRTARVEHDRADAVDVAGERVQQQRVVVLEGPQLRRF